MAGHYPTGQIKTPSKHTIAERGSKTLNVRYKANCVLLQVSAKKLKDLQTTKELNPYPPLAIVKNNRSSLYEWDPRHSRDDKFGVVGPLGFRPELRVNYQKGAKTLFFEVGEQPSYKGDKGKGKANAKGKGKKGKAKSFPTEGKLSRDKIKTSQLNRSSIMGVAKEYGSAWLDNVLVHCQLIP